jgi:hypothetical protein
LLLYLRGIFFIRILSTKKYDGRSPIDLYLTDFNGYAQEICHIDPVYTPARL